MSDYKTQDSKRMVKGLGISMAAILVIGGIYSGTKPNTKNVNSLQALEPGYEHVHGCVWEIFPLSPLWGAASEDWVRYKDPGNREDCAHLCAIDSEC